jgi:hypothetical protein
MYGVDWSKFIWERVPSVTSKPVHLAWLRALVQPLVGLHNRFLNFRASKALDLSITSSKRHLQYWLNKLFDPDEKRIELKNYEQIDPLFMFLESENRPIYLPTFIGAQDYDGEVCIPCELKDQEVQIRGFLDRYKMVTVRYLITWTGICADTQIIVDDE